MIINQGGVYLCRDGSRFVQQHPPHRGWVRGDDLVLRNMADGCVWSFEAVPHPKDAISEAAA